MDWQFAAVLVICLITEQIEKLCVDHGDQEVKCTVRIAHDKEQRRFPVTQLVQFQLIVHGGIPDFLNIKGCEPGTAGNKDGLSRFARNELSRTFSSNSQKIHKKGARSTVWLLTPRLIDYIFPFSRSLQRYA